MLLDERVREVVVGILLMAARLGVVSDSMVSDLSAMRIVLRVVPLYS